MRNHCSKKRDERGETQKKEKREDIRETREKREERRSRENREIEKVRDKREERRDYAVRLKSESQFACCSTVRHKTGMDRRRGCIGERGSQVKPGYAKALSSPPTIRA